MSDFLGIDENHHNSFAESPKQLSTNGSLTEVGSPNDDHKPDITPRETDHTAHDGEGEGSGDEDYDSEDGEDDDEEDDYEDDDEPALKYERLAGSVPDMLLKDSASSLAVTDKLIAFGTHGGIVHIVDLTGKRLKSFKPHMASVVDVVIDPLGEFIGTASIDGQVVIHSINTPESYSFDHKRPMRSIALEPNFSKRGTRSFVCGGLAGNLILHEKGWLGHKETILHNGEGPIWQVRWRGTLIAWANDLGIKIYDTASSSRITFIDRPADAPRADLFKCNMHWQDDSTLLIGWADQIKVARIRARPRTTTSSASANVPPLLVEITAVFQLDCMAAGIVPHPSGHEPLSLTSFLIIAYTPPDTSFYTEATEDRAQQARKVAERPELRIISRAGEELAADALGISGFQSWGCNDYTLAEIKPEGTTGRCYIVLSPQDIVIVKPRDRRDHIDWLVDRQRYEEALEELEKLGDSQGGDINASEIGQKYIEHLVAEGEFAKAARLCPKVCGQNIKRWEDWIFVFAQKGQIDAIIPYVPTENPKLGRLVYEMILAHFLGHNRQTLLKTIKAWPKDIYDIPSVIVALESELDKTPSPSKMTSGGSDTTILMECLAELYIANRQPGKALQFFLRLRRPNVFDLIRENNLFTDVRDQALLLVEFDQELFEKQKKEQEAKGVQLDAEDAIKTPGISLLVDHTHSIPIARVVQQLQTQPYFLFLYLHALFTKDPLSTVGFGDTQVRLYAEYAGPRLIDFLRGSNSYNLELAYNVCHDRDLVPEMVFLLGRMGNNRQALTLIIERMGDVNRAIDFAKEQNDDDLWEDLLRYSETRPTFIRGLLENVGAGIDPIRLIRRIKNGLEIPGLKPALIKILQDFNLQLSLLDGCKTILDGDCADLAKRFYKDQTSGFFLSGKTICPICTLPLQQHPQGLVLLFLCRHVVHAKCARGGGGLPHQSASTVFEMRIGSGPSTSSVISGKIAFASMVRSRIRDGCPVCHRNAEGQRT